MKRKKNKKEEPSYKELFFDTLEKILLKLFIYFFLTAIVFLAGKFLWWLGICFFVVLTVFMLFEISLNGFGFFMGIITTIISVTLNYYLKLKNKTPKPTEDLYSYGLMGFTLHGIFSIFLLGLAYSLYIFFFHQSV